jgi:hypothetical protein
MRRHALLLSLLAITACRKPETRVVVQQVQVPVPVPCPAPPPRRPLVLPITALPADATPQQQAQALKATLMLLLGRLDEAEALLDGYRAQPLQEPTR